MIDTPIKSSRSQSTINQFFVTSGDLRHSLEGIVTRINLSEQALAEKDSLKLDELDEAVSNFQAIKKDLENTLIIWDHGNKFDFQKKFRIADF